MLTGALLANGVNDQFQRLAGLPGRNVRAAKLNALAEHRKRGLRHEGRAAAR
jgi:hypothetical protein